MAPLPQIKSHTIDAIVSSYEADQTPNQKFRVSFSMIGDPCERKLTYIFRWAVAPEVFDGAKLRLFQTGHREEARMIEDLRRICTVHDIDPATEKQFRAETADGHAVGYMDGIVEGIVEAPATPHVLECKTHNAKSFNELKKKQVEEAKPLHYAQMQSYMHLFGLDRAFYMAHNKDTDELYGERIEYDPTYAGNLMAKAARIVQTHDLPPKLHTDPDAKAAFVCRFCPAKAVCHEGAFAPVNCRTCLHSTPIPGGKFWCERFGRELSGDEQKAGCPAHLFLPDLVPGEQIDADPSAETVTYRMPDGSEYVDGRKGVENQNALV